MPMLLARSRDEALATAAARGRRGARTGLVLCRPLDPAEPAPASIVHALGEDPVAYARHLYAALHALEAAVDAIIVEPVPEDEAWDAVADRLRRGSHPA